MLEFILKNDFYKMKIIISKSKLLLFLDKMFVFFSLTLFSPFIIISAFKIPHIIKYVIFIFTIVYFMFRINKKIQKKIFFFGFSLLTFLMIYFMYYILLKATAINSNYDFLMFFVYSIILYLFLSYDDYLIGIIKGFIPIVIFISILTILSFVCSTFKLTMFRADKIAGYTVYYNFIFGLVHVKNFIMRPSLYFAEPSYLGFFLGFCFFYIQDAIWLKKRSVLSIVVLIAGIVSYSFTFYVPLIVGLIVKLFEKTIAKGFKNRMVNFYFIGFLLISVIYLGNIRNVNNTVLSKFQTSLDDRKARIARSDRMLEKETTTQIFFGCGPGSIVDVGHLGESDAFLKLLIEEGLILLIIVLVLIYSNLKYNTYLLLFSLFALHSVILIETPLFIFLLSIGTIYTKLYTNPEKYLRLLL